MLMRLYKSCVYSFRLLSLTEISIPDLSFKLFGVVTADNIFLYFAQEEVEIFKNDLENNDMLESVLSLDFYSGSHI